MVLSIEALTSTYPGHVAVADVNAIIEPGEVVAIVGPNGCGKSTLLRSIARLHRPVAGRVRVGGDDVWRLRPRQVARRLSLLPQQPELPEAMTVAGLVRFGRHPHQGLFRQWSPADEQAVAHALAATGTTGLADRRVDRLSGGQRQRCWLAMALAQQSPLMLLDEPTSMLDMGHQLEVLQLVRKLAGTGRTVVMVVHDVNAAMRFADRLLAMNDGRLVADGSPRQVMNPALIRQLYGVEAEVLISPRSGRPVVVPDALSSYGPLDAAVTRALKEH
ncbi:ABC transporter ATP-binding protein [Arhodomonas sp. AD133]|uniref:ABC transporter ATP-binding protein n=1 Tax=Arhodomonas sp. AD133 TaxID=3415009 RepID=UPI003EB71E67